MKSFLETRTSSFDSSKPQDVTVGLLESLRERHTTSEEISISMATYGRMTQWYHALAKLMNTTLVFDKQISREGDFITQHPNVQLEDPKQAWWVSFANGFEFVVDFRKGENPLNPKTGVISYYRWGNDHGFKKIVDKFTKMSDLLKIKDSGNYRRKPLPEIPQNSPKASTDPQTDNGAPDNANGKSPTLTFATTPGLEVSIVGVNDDLLTLKIKGTSYSYRSNGQFDINVILSTFTKMSKYSTGQALNWLKKVTTLEKKGEALAQGLPADEGYVFETIEKPDDAPGVTDKGAPDNADGKEPSLVKPSEGAEGSIDKDSLGKAYDNLIAGVHYAENLAYFLEKYKSELSDDDVDKKKSIDQIIDQIKAL